MELQAKEITFHINKTLAFQTHNKLSIYDIMPLLKDKRTASSLKYLLNLRPNKQAQEFNHKIKILHSNPQFFKTYKAVAQERNVLQVQKRKLQERLLQATRKREASASLVDARRRERNQLRYAIREAKTVGLQLMNEAQELKKNKESLFALTVNFQKDISHVSIVPSFEEFQKIASATHFLCDVLATTKQGQIPTSIPDIESPSEFNKFNKNEMIVHFNASIIRFVQEIGSLQAQSAQVMAMTSLEKKKKYLEEQAQLIREKREQNKTHFLQNQKTLALVNKKHESLHLTEGQRLLFYSKYYQGLIAQKKAELEKFKAEVSHEESMIWSTLHEQEMLQRLQCIQSLFTLFLKHKKRVDTFVEKKVLPIGEQLKNDSRESSHNIDLQIKLITEILGTKTQVPLVSLISDNRFQILDQRGGEILHKFGWRNYQTLECLFE